MRILWSLAFFALFALSPPAGAEAALPIVVERGAGAERCPEADTLATRVELIRGRPAASLPAPYRVTFARRDDGFVATIRSDASTGRVRTLEHDGPLCAALGNAVAVTLALLLDSDVAPQKSVEPPPAPLLPPTQPAPPIAPPAGPPARDVTFSIGGALLAGVLRPVSPAFVAELGAGWAPFRMSAGAILAWPAAVTLGPGKVHQSLAGGLALVCVAPWQQGGLRLDTCSGVVLARVLGEAEGYTRNERHTRTWLAIPVEVALAGFTSPFGWELSFAGLLPLERPDFAIDGVGVAYASPPIGAMLSLRAIGILPF